MKHSLVAELLAEFLGTLVLIVFGNGVVAMVVLFGHGVPGEIVNGGFTNITLAWGLAVTMGVYVAGKISGAFVAAALVFWNYHPAFLRVDPQLDHTAGVFTTFPAFPEALSAGLLD